MLSPFLRQILSGSLPVIYCRPRIEPLDYVDGIEIAINIHYQWVYSRGLLDQAPPPWGPDPFDAIPF